MQKWFLRGSFHWWFWPKRPNICDCGWDTRFLIPLIPILWHRHGCHGISLISPYFSHFWAHFWDFRFQESLEMPMPGGPTLRELLSGWSGWAALGSNHRCCRRSQPRTSQRFRWRSGGDWQQRILLQFHQQRKWHYGKLEQLFFGLNFFWNVEYLNVFVYPFWKI